jgi:hypothetical protein
MNKSLKERILGKKVEKSIDVKEKVRLSRLGDSFSFEHTNQLSYIKNVIVLYKVIFILKL